jgi:DNA-binding NarL/FixJ family response regulator
LAAFEAAGGFAGLNPEDSERMAWSLTWTGPPATSCLDAFERVEAAYRQVGDPRGAARAALEQARMNALIGNELVAASCWARAVGYLGDDRDCPEYGLAYVLAAYAQLIEGHVDDVADLAGIANEIGRRVGDPTVEAMSDYVAAQATLLTADTRGGLALLDRAISLALNADAHPMYAGLIYCGVLWSCRQIGDWSRAAEWHEVATRWCRRESIVHFPAHLSVHRAELLRIRGRFEEAEAAALASLEEAGDWSRDVLAWGFHQLGEVRVCLGDLAAADEAFARAGELGYEPEPGRSRLLLTRGRPEAALRSITRAIENPHWYALSSLVYRLPVGVSVAVTLGRLDLATQWASRLDELAVRYGTRGPLAASLVARGEIALARRDAAEAIEKLTAGAEAWRSAEAPYDAACARVLLARAYAAEDEHDQARLELGTALAGFERLGAFSDRARIERFQTGTRTLLSALGAPSPVKDHGGLTQRQLEVAALVAKGLTNKQIADELIVSRYTAETHVKNILTRLGLSSRAEIAAWATEQGLTSAGASQPAKYPVSGMD